MAGIAFLDVVPLLYSVLEVAREEGFQEEAPVEEGGILEGLVGAAQAIQVPSTTTAAGAAGRLVILEMVVKEAMEVLPIVGLMVRVVEVEVVLVEGEQVSLMVGKVVEWE